MPSLLVLFLLENRSLLFGWLLNILIYMDSIMCNIIVIYNSRYKWAMKEVTPSAKDQYSREKEWEKGIANGIGKDTDTIEGDNRTALQ